MSFNTDLKLAYQIGYDDALARRKPDASKAQVLAPCDLATEYAKLREQLEKSEERRERQADNLINKCHTIARLQTENAKLRKQSERLFDKTLELASENSKLRELCKLCEREAENAKLRTALSAVLQCNGITKRDKGCDACPMYDKEKEYVWAGDWCGIRQFIRELGIEVDE